MVRIMQKASVMQRKSNSLKYALMTTVLFAAACGGDDSGNGTGADAANTSTPTVQSNSPLEGAVGVPLNGIATATFSEPMALDSISTTSFTLTTGTPPITVDGTVTYADSTATFRPSALYAVDTTFSATITTAATSASGIALGQDYAWTFSSGDTLADELPVTLGSAGDFAILAKSAISTVPTSAITGDIGVSPAAATFITGFSLTADATNEFATAPQVVGKIYAADFAPPTPAKMTTAISDMEIAFTAASARAPSVTELGAGNIGGMTLTSGVYKWGTGLLIPTDLTLSGSATDVWIFQIAQDLTMSSGARVVLEGGALPENIVWQVSGLVDLGTTAHCEGIILTKTSATLRTGATVNGRIMAQTAVDIDGSTVVQP